MRHAGRCPPAQAATCTCEVINDWRSHCSSRWSPEVRIKRLAFLKLLWNLLITRKAILSVSMLINHRVVHLDLLDQLLVPDLHDLRAAHHDHDHDHDHGVPDVLGEHGHERQLVDLQLDQSYLFPEA